MTELSQEIFSKYQVRKTRKQKAAFINLIKSRYPEAAVEMGGMADSRNIVIGNVGQAKAILTAHYDTCAALPIPNFIMPKNMIITVLYSLIFTVPMFAAAYILGTVTHSFLIAYFSFLFVAFGTFTLMFFGKPNKNTANDNTSGVIELCELMDALGEEKRNQFAFVFFDNEEYGLLGSALFKKIHKREIADKLIINYDCVSDGDNIMFILTKKAQKKYSEAFKTLNCATEEKNFIVAKTSNTYYPSDQTNFSVSIGVAALKEKRGVGYYMNRIHTKRDVIFDEANIKFICNMTVSFLLLL